MAGPKLRALGIEEFFPMENLQAMGLSDVLSSVPRIFRAFFTIRRRLLQQNPRAIVFVDYAEFNLRLETSLRKKGYSGAIIHYVSPSVWAWRKGRKKTLEASADLLLSILPFEKEHYQDTRLRVEYVGHPLTASTTPSSAPRRPVIALFPGSRRKEIERNLPLQLKTARALKEKLPLAISVAQESLRPLIASLAPKEALVSPQESRSLMQEAALALATSGTVTLELALFETPTVVLYSLSPLDTWLAKHLFKLSLPYYALPNLLAQEEIFPEFFGPCLSETALAAAVNAVFEKRNQIAERCQKVRKILGEKKASLQAAGLIKEVLVDFPRLRK